ncbi:MAG TPA: hypothetical protein VFS11_11305 [Gemmatimonadales bacterium]|nr:hypothetical protein [Gemmatimonadales bacterium]
MRSSLSCLLMLGLAAGCSPRESRAPAAEASKDQPAAPAAAPAGPEGQTVVVTATDYAFDAPATIPAGLTTFRLVNRGKELHHMVLLKIPEGKTLEDVAKESKGEMPPSWVHFDGGPNAVDPGSETSVTQIVEPGHYALVCVIPSPDGKPHMMKGMARTLDVTGPAAAAAATPPADVTLKLADYSFITSKPLTAGSHVIRVENAGPQPHEIVLLKLAPGKSAQDFVNWAMKPSGPPPASAIGGISPMDNGRTSLMHVNLTPGEYAFVCFIPDAKDGKPHLAHGMIQQIRVE